MAVILTQTCIDNYITAGSCCGVDYANDYVIAKTYGDEIKAEESWNKVLAVKAFVSALKRYDADITDPDDNNCLTTEEINSMLQKILELCPSCNCGTS